MSMPGMMDTVLNLGLNDETVAALAEKTGNPRFAWDSYRRFIQMYGDVVMGVEHDFFEEALQAVKDERGAKLDTDLDTEGLQEVVRRYKDVVEKHAGRLFPMIPTAAAAPLMQSSVPGIMPKRSAIGRSTTSQAIGVPQ